jgi:hypothetical protein
VLIECRNQLAPIGGSADNIELGERTSETVSGSIASRHMHPQPLGHTSRLCAFQHPKCATCRHLKQVRDSPEMESKRQAHEEVYRTRTFDWEAANRAERLGSVQSAS